MSKRLKQSWLIINLNSLILNHYFLRSTEAICVDLIVISNFYCRFLNSVITCSFYLSFKQRPNNLFLFFWRRSNTSFNNYVIDGLLYIFCYILRLFIYNNCLFLPSNSIINLFIRVISSLRFLILMEVGR
jgi:hypothetical protein